MIEPPVKDEQIQAPIPDDPLPPVREESKVKIKPLERPKLHPKTPPEVKIYGKHMNFSRYWILWDGRETKLHGSEMKDKFDTPTKALTNIGVRRRLMTDYFWEEMLSGLMDELEDIHEDGERCSEYDSNYLKEGFVERDLTISNPDTYLKYPLYGTGSSAITFYSQTIKKTNGDILEKFRKTQDFTKPIGERLDDGWVL